MFSFSFQRTFIINFIESYNAVKLYASQQTAVGDDGTPEEDSILAGDSTLRLIMSRINEELAQEIKGLAGSDFSRLSDLGITFSDFPGDEETPFTRNILVLDEEKLDSALSTGFEAVRDVFEFKSTSDNNDFQIFERGNGLAVTDYSITVDSIAGTYTATYDLGGTPTTVDLDVDTLSDGTLVLKGKNGTALASMTMLFSNPTDTTINVSTTQGIADRLFNTLDGLLKEETGAIDVAIKSMEDDATRYEKEIDTIDARIERYRETLISQFSALEAAISQANTLLQSLDAQANARNNN
jgi:flagellar hook-associated protein 2